MTESRISGELYHTTGYTGFSGSSELQEGYYLALKFDAPEGATVKVEMIGALTNHGLQELDSDMNAVFRITDKLNQKIRVVAEMDGYETTEKVYRISGLTMLSIEAPAQDNG